MTFSAHQVGVQVRLTSESYARRASKHFPDCPMTITEVHPHVPTEPGIEPLSYMWSYTVQIPSLPHYELRPVSPG